MSWSNEKKYLELRRQLAFVSCEPLVPDKTFDTLLLYELLIVETKENDLNGKRGSIIIYHMS